ncbi:MAG: hypothetical protein R6X12_03670 [bacterium]
MTPIIPGSCCPSSLIARIVLASVVLGAGAGAADLHARRMEIVQTPNGQETVFRDSVTIVDGSTLITARFARFNESRGVAVVSESVRIVDPRSRVEADSAVYRLDARVTELFGRVRVELDSLSIAAPHLLYFVEEGRVEADDGLEIRTPGNGLTLRGARGRYWMDSRVGEVDSQPELVISEGDSVTAGARTMTWHGEDGSALLAGGVRVGTRATSLTADSLYWWTRADTGVAWGSPRVADSLSSTTGDTIRLAVESGALRRVAVTGGAQGRYRSTGTSEVEVAGEVITIRLERGELDVVEVERLARGWLVERGGGEPGS